MKELVVFDNKYIIVVLNFKGEKDVFDEIYELPG